MDSITQDMRYRQSIMRYAEKYGVQKASRKYNKARSYIYFWKARYDGTLESLRPQSRRPHGHPRAHTEAELKLICDMRRRNPELGLVELLNSKRSYYTATFNTDRLRPAYMGRCFAHRWWARTRSAAHKRKRETLVDALRAKVVDVDLHITNIVNPIPLNSLPKRHAQPVGLKTLIKYIVLKRVQPHIQY